MPAPEPRPDEVPDPSRGRGRAGGAGRRLRRALAALLLGLVLALVVGEALLRVTLRADRHRVHPPNLELVRHPDPSLLPGVAGTARFATDAAGLRADGEPAEGSTTVLCLGGSTTACEYLDQASAWPARLGALLAQESSRPVWVGNAGRSGTTAADHVVQLPPLLEEQPGLDVLVLLVGVNDLAEAVRDGERASDDGVRRARGTGMDPGERAERLERAFHERPRTFAAWPPSATALAYLLRRQRARAWDRAALEDDAARAYGERRALRAAALARSPARDELPDLGPALVRYRQHLQFLTRTARRAGVVPVLATQPVLWRADLEPEAAALCWFGWIGAAPWDGPEGYLSLAALARGMAAFDDVTRQVGAEEGVEVVDLAFEVPRTRANFYDDCHLTDAGAARVAELLAPALRRALGQR